MAVKTASMRMEGVWTPSPNLPSGHATVVGSGVIT